MTCLGTLILANASNSLVATALQIGHSNSGNPGAQTGNSGTVTLGAGVNTLAVNTINIGCSKSGGTLKFASQAAGSPGTVTIGGRTRATTEFLIGGKTLTGTGYTPVGILDLRGHVADVAAGTVTLGKEDGAITYTSGTTGNLSFDAGTFTATNLNLAAKSGFSTGAATATLTVSGGVFTVTEGGSFSLASQVGWGTANGTLNLHGGTFTCNADIRGGVSNATSTITLNGGTLDMTGHALGLGSQTVSVFTVQSGTLRNLSQINTGAPLVKTGPGTLTLEGTNTYTGATVVSNGTLRLTGAACLPPTADIYLFTGATNQLDYVGALPVHALYIDGVLKRGSLYGQSNLPAFLSGTGYLQLPQQATLLLLR
jgi:autotransporter-associated beta strand protein